MVPFGSAALPKFYYFEKDGPGPVMVSNTLCPAMHILGSQNVYDRAEGIADHYWPWAVFFHSKAFSPDSLALPDGS